MIRSRWRVQCLVVVALIATAPLSAAADRCVPEIVTVRADGTDVERGEALRRAIETSPGCQVIRLASATYFIASSARPGGGRDGIWITADDLTIEGAGPQSLIQLARDTYIGLVVRPGVRNLIVRDLAIRGALLPSEAPRRRYKIGSDTLPCMPIHNPEECFSGAQGTLPPTHGIATYSGVWGVENVVITKVTLSDLAVGISVGAETDGICIDAAYRNVTISRNSVHNIYGRDSGSGYGINATCAQHVLIMDNVISNTGRHAIYQGKTLTAGDALSDVLIIRNTVVDHGHVASTYADPNRTAIAVARSRNVTVLANSVIASHEPGISIESEGIFQAENNAVIGNHFIALAGATKPDIWLNTQAQSVVWANTSNSTPVRNEIGAKVKDDWGCRTAPPFWEAGIGTQWIEFAGSAAEQTARAGSLERATLYVMQNNVLHRVTPIWGTNPGTRALDSWPYVYSKTDWSYGQGFQGMAQADGVLFVMQHNILHRVTFNEATGEWRVSHSRTWWGPAFASISAGGGFVHVVQNGELHRVRTTRMLPQDSQVLLGEEPATASRQAAGIVYIRRGKVISEYDAALNRLADID
jgi:hypothetical protein